MADKRVFTLSQVAQHKSKNNCWLVINGRVLNVTEFLEEHPGGEEVLIECAGKDASKEFKDIGHSKAAENLLLKYLVGVLPGYTLKEGNTMDSPIRQPKNKEMTAFVIKDDGLTKYPAFLEFLVPLLVAGSYFSYRYLTGIFN